MTDSPDHPVPSWRIKMEVAGETWTSTRFSDEERVKQRVNELQNQDAGSQIRAVRTDTPGENDPRTDRLGDTEFEQVVEIAREELEAEYPDERLRNVGLQLTFENQDGCVREWGAQLHDCRGNTTH